MGRTKNDKDNVDKLLNVEAVKEEDVVVEENKVVEDTFILVETPLSSPAVAPTPAKEKRVFHTDDIIICKSVTAGELIAKGKKTGNTYVWAGYGDDAEVAYGDIQSWKSSKSSFIYAPQFLIEDEELLEERTYADIKDLYNTLYKIGDIKALFNLDNKTFKKALDKAPLAMRTTIKSIATDMIKDGSLDSLDKITTIDKVLNTNLITYIK